jgi:hypothetical protein
MRPGTTLLKIAPLLFNDHFLAKVVHPTIADLQSEADAAERDRIKRLRVLCRGYTSFWTLIVLAPFASWSDNRADLTTARLAAGSAVVAVLMVATVGAWTALIVAAGALVAFLIHAWHERHPSEIAVLPERRWRSPQINFSSTDVGGNAGGLIFVVGSVFIVSLGLPSVIWFLLTGALAAGFVAWGLAVWHRRTPREDWISSSFR